MSEEIARFRADHDAFGHMLLDFLETGEAEEIIEREDGLIDGGMNCEYYFRDFAAWPPHQQEAIRHLVPGRVLDLGCGAGRVELYLQGQGIQVTGIDISPLAVEVCRRRGVHDARLLSVTQLTRSLGNFDNVLMLGNNWGLMGSRKRAHWLLRRLHSLTTPGARLIAETNDVYRTANPFHLAYQAYNRERGRMSGQIRIRSLYKMYRSAWFDYLMVSQAEMVELLAGSGWQVDHFIDAPESSAYIAVIVKQP